MVHLQQLRINTQWTGFHGRGEFRVNDLPSQGRGTVRRCLRQSRVVDIQHDPLKTAMRQPVFSHQRLFGSVDPQPAVFGFLQEQRLSSMERWNRVDVAAIMDGTVAGCLPVRNLAGVKARARQRL